MSVEDICKFVYKCIENKEFIYYNYFGGFVIPKFLIEIRSCWYSDLKQISINFNNQPHAAEDIVVLRDVSASDMAKFEEARQAVIEYNKNLLNEIILNYD